MIKKTLKITLFLIFFICGLCHAQEAGATDSFWNGIGKVASFGRPFWADMHSTLLRAEIAYATNSPDYDWGGFDTSSRFYIFSNLGVDIPVWSGDFANSRYGFNLTLPFMIDIWFDFFERTTSPVINTAYRFGAFEANFIYRLSSPIPVLPYFNIHNWSLKLSLLKHESTHIGDELTIYRKDLGLPITRIDVLSNHGELVFTLNDPDNQARVNHGFKFGLLLNYNLRAGWYGFLDTEADPEAVEPARFPFEFNIQYQYQSPLFYRGFQAIASAEWRLRQRYKYSFSYSGSKNEQLQNNPDIMENYESRNLVSSFNFFAGIRYDNQKPNYFSKTGVGARFYFGQNPYGQFRSMPHFRQFGLAAIFE